MVTAVMTDLVLSSGFGEEVWTPIGDAANDAALGEDEAASCADNAVGECHQLVELW